MVETICVAIEFANDTVGIMQFVIDDGKSIKRRAVTNEMIDNEITKSSFSSELLPIKSWKIIHDTENQVPTDRTYRNAWVLRENQVIHDMDKAKEIHKNFLRKQRKPLLEALDTQYMKALEINDITAQADIRNKKQYLRDITGISSISNAKTVEELKLIQPLS